MSAEATVSADILQIAREQVLERGEPLDQDQVLAVLQTSDDELEELLALAHQVRLQFNGPEVEVEGIISLKTGGCPEDCHFCSQSGLFPSPVRAAWLDVPSLVKAAVENLGACALEDVRHGKQDSPSPPAVRRRGPVADASGSGARGAP